MLRELTTRPGQYGSREVALMFATYLPSTAKQFFGGTNVSSPEPANGFRPMEMYICRGCGFTEWYCQTPEQIPIGAIHSTELMTAPSDGPLR